MASPGVGRRVARLLPTVVQALALVVCVHMVGQELVSRYGSAKFMFSKSYQAAGYGYGSNKAKKEIRYVVRKLAHNTPGTKPTKGAGGKGKPSKGRKPAKGGQKYLSIPSTSSTTPAPPPPLPELVEEQERRLEQLRRTCGKYGLGSHGPPTLQPREEVQAMRSFLSQQSLPMKPLWQNLLCAREQGVSLCPLYKAASTFLVKKMLLLAPSGKYDRESVRRLEAEAWPGEANVHGLARTELGYLRPWTLYPDFTSNGTSIIFVRHPFERLLSAFRDKLEDPSVKGRRPNDYYYNKHGRRIVMHYRRKKVRGPNWKYPRFSEFVDYVLGKDVRLDDEHWSPYYRDCTPCHINYTFVGHFESLYWDMHLLANRTGLAVWDDERDHLQPATHRGVTEEYFATLERGKIRRLYTRYKLDFELFGYSPDTFIEMGIPGPRDTAEQRKTQTETEVIPDTDPENEKFEKIISKELKKENEESNGQY